MTETDAQNFLILTGRIGTYILILPVAVMLYRYKAFLKSPYIFLFFSKASVAILNAFITWFVAYTSVTENYLKIADFLKKWEIDDTFFMDPLFFLSDFIFIGLFIYHKSETEKFRKFILALIVALSVFTIINAFWGETYKDYQSWGTILNNLFLVFAGAILINFIFQNNLNKPIYKIPEYFFALTFIISGAIGGLIDVLSNSMFSETKVLFFQMHIIRNIFNIMGFILFSYGAFIVRKSR